MLEGAKASGMDAAYHYMDKAQLAKDLKDLSKPGDVLLFKGSRGMKMEQALEYYLQEK